MGDHRPRDRIIDDASFGAVTYQAKAEHNPGQRLNGMAMTVPQTQHPTLGIVEGRQQPGLGCITCELDYSLSLSGHAFVSFSSF
jgi:hypothetical protein